MCQLLDKVEEMALVMQQAVRVDDAHANQNRERIACLEMENKTLRQLLEICTTANHPIVADSVLDLPPSVSLDSSCSSQVSQIEVKPAIPDDSPGGEEKVICEKKS